MDGSFLRFEHWQRNIVPSADVWRDYYTGQALDNFLNVSSSSGDKNFHCMIVSFKRRNCEKEAIVQRYFCLGQEVFSCVCQSKRQPPILRLLGLCEASTLRGTGTERGYGIRTLQDI